VVLKKLDGSGTTFQGIVGSSSPLYALLAGYTQLTTAGSGDIDTISVAIGTPANQVLAANIAANPPSVHGNVQSYFLTQSPPIGTGLYNIIQSIDVLLASSIDNANLLSSASAFVTSTVKPILQNLVNLEMALASSPPTSPPESWLTGYIIQYVSGLFTSTALSGIATHHTLTAGFSVSTSTDLLQGLSSLATQLASAQQVLVNMGPAMAVNLEASLKNQLPGYGNIIDMLTTIANTTPPSGAMAGIYAATDNSRGVWKAPANVSVNSVAGMDTVIDAAMQENMNIDTIAGKSVNAIRPFYGEGLVVWGARTLAGNDNNWRYVPVRRFTSFVEESCKRSTKWAVFEPNDANLWVKVRCEIENFLYTQWSAGALAGAKPSDAYYVHCGLGTTMTAQDILNGYLKVLIGMAVVRPAEFIILEYTQILQVS